MLQLDEYLTHPQAVEALSRVLEYCYIDTR